MQHNNPQFWRCSCSALFETNDGLHYHLQSIQYRHKLANAELQSLRDHFAVTTLPDQRSEDEPPSSDISCPKCDQIFHSRRDLRKHYRTHVSCFEICVYCHRPFACRATDFLAHQHKEPTATATYAAAVAIEDEDKDGEDHEGDAKDNELKKVYMAERRELVLKRVERSLKRAEMKRKRPPAGPPDAIQHKRPLLMSDLLDKGDPSRTDNFNPIPQPEAGASEPALRLDAYPPSGTESSNHAQLSMAGSGRDNAEPLSRMYMTKLTTKVLPGDLEGGGIDQHSLASNKGFDATGEASPVVYMTSSSDALSGHYMAVLDQHLLAGSRLDVADDPLVDVEPIPLLLQDLPDVHERFNYGWEDDLL